MLNKLFTYLARLILSIGLTAMTVTLALALVHIPLAWHGKDGTTLALALGFGGGFLVFTMFSKFLIFYVFGHELTHFVAAKLFFRKTGRLQFGAASGSIAVERPNIWITLAPYFVPVYTLLWIGLYGTVDFFLENAAPWLPITFAAGVGVTYAFHVRLTLYALTRQQSDLRRYGRILSLSFIAFCNVLLLYLGLLAATGKWGQGVKAVHLSAVKEWRMIHRASTSTRVYLSTVHEQWRDR